jgi:hypothetical protein
VAIVSGATQKAVQKFDFPTERTPILLLSASSFGAARSVRSSFPKTATALISDRVKERALGEAAGPAAAEPGRTQNVLQIKRLGRAAFHNGAAMSGFEMAGRSGFTGSAFPTVREELPEADITNC